MCISRSNGLDHTHGEAWVSPTDPTLSPPWVQCAKTRWVHYRSGSPPWNMFVSPRPLVRSPRDKQTPIGCEGNSRKCQSEEIERCYHVIFTFNKLKKAFFRRKKSPIHPLTHARTGIKVINNPLLHQIALSIEYQATLLPGWRSCLCGWFGYTRPWGT